MPAPSPARRGDTPPAGYLEFLADVKTLIAAARTRAALAVNSELILLYREIGLEILERERREGRGAKVIDRLAADLRREFPEMTGLSRSNLFQQPRPAPGDGGQEPPGRLAFEPAVRTDVRGGPGGGRLPRRPDMRHMIRRRIVYRLSG
jgi:hypothetical protein